MLPLTIFILTFNCGRSVVNIDSFSNAFSTLFEQRESREAPDLIVLSLQEVAPYAQSFLGGSFLDPYFANLVASVQKAAETYTQQYARLATLNVGMTGIIVLAKEELTGIVQAISTAGVGVGDYDLGNKGAAAVRIQYSAKNLDQPAILTFVAAHLAPFEDAWERRNEDWKNIVRGLSFHPFGDVKQHKLRHGFESISERAPLLDSSSSSENTGLFMPGSLTFFAGDLNYRTRDTGPTPEDSKRFPQPQDNQDSTQSSSYFTVESLRETDQLNRERKAGRTLQGLDEAPFTFPPTYKYADNASEHWPRDGSEPKAWIWSKHRFPSFCDRILFSSSFSGPEGPLKVSFYTAAALQPTSDHRPVALDCQLDLSSSEWKDVVRKIQSNLPFPLNPDWKQRRAAARWKETYLGAVAYLAMTWNGNGLILASLLGALGGWAVMRSLVA